MPRVAGVARCARLFLMPWRFENCWQRIERAKAHSKTLSDTWNDLCEKETYSAVVRVDDDGTGRIWVEPIHFAGFPPVASLELGEMLYQLRAALDGSIYQAAIIDSGQNPPPNEKGLAFPIFSNAKDFHDASFKIKPLAQKRRDFVESIQPYNAPNIAPDLMVWNFNRTLGIINDWARIDRHRRLHFIGSWASNAAPKLRLPAGVTLVSLIVTGAGFLEHESQVAEFRLDGWVPGMNIQANPDLLIDIAVNEPPPPCADHDSLGNRIEAMLRATAFVVDWLEQSFS